MKKLFLSLLLFVSFFFASGFTTLAEEYPNTMMKLTYTTHEFYTERTSTYEYRVYYRVPMYIYGDKNEIGYYLINQVNLSFIKGTNQNTNAYYLWQKRFVQGQTEFTFIITVEKTVINSYFTNPYDVRRMFEEFTAIYVSYEASDEEEYNRGYLDGYDKGLEDGFKDGYQVGYNEGKEAGLSEGYRKGYEDGIVDSETEAYNTGYRHGYDDGFYDGKRETESIAYNKGYEDGYNKGFNDGASADYKRGYQDGANDKYLNDIAKWFGPMVLIVLIAGAYVTTIRRRRDD